MRTRTFELDFEAVRKGFRMAASTYDAAAGLQHRIESDLIERLSLLDLRPEWILDLGCGTGHAGPSLARHYPRAGIIGLDAAFEMLHWKQAQPDRHSAALCADARALPLAPSSMDLVFSNLLLQWFDDPTAALSEVYRILRDRSAFLFATFGPRTFQELREAWSQVDTAPHVSAFLDGPTWGGLLMREGFVEVVLDVDIVLEEVADLKTLANQLRQIGATNRHAQRARGLLGRTHFEMLTRAYEAMRRPGGGLPVTYEILYGLAWTPMRFARPKGA
ncbi:MAG: malonyl-ACP O-methyltransferase BioC [Gammaproteobacteria bacterium]